MTKEESRRTALIEKLADHMLAHGLIGSSLRPLAKAAGTSDRMLLYYFRDKEELASATLEHIAARMVMLMDARRAPEPLGEEPLLAHIIEALGDAAFWPSMRLWLEIASRAASGDAFYKALGGQIGRGFLMWTASQLAEPDEAHKLSQAARVLRATEGWLFLKAIGLDDVNAAALTHA
jgi:AcrR family transcriptional regulator